MTEPIDFAVHQEADVVAAGTLYKVGVASIAVAAVGIFFAGLILVTTSGALRPRIAGAKGALPVGSEISKIEQTPIRDTRRGIDLRNEQERELESWGWVDRGAGVATIPIGRAMDLVVEQSR